MVWGNISGLGIHLLRDWASTTAQAAPVPMETSVNTNLIQVLAEPTPSLTLLLNMGLQGPFRATWRLEFVQRGADLLGLCAVTAERNHLLASLQAKPQLINGSLLAALGADEALLLQSAALGGRESQIRQRVNRCHGRFTLRGLGARKHRQRARLRRLGLLGFLGRHFFDGSRQPQNHIELFVVIGNSLRGVQQVIDESWHEPGL